MALKRPHSDSQTPSKTHIPQEVYKSQEIHDRASIFKAHFHPFPTSISTSSIPSTSTFFSSTSIKYHQHHPDFKDAMHRILGWRKPSTQQTLSISKTPLSQSLTSSTTRSTTATKQICTTTSDDDGEKYAGKYLAKVLDELDVCGILVVARWYGGVLLGPVRFTYVENVAREAVDMYLDDIGRSRGGIDGGVKRMRVDDVGGPGMSQGSQILNEAEEKKRLVKRLEDRDQSISVLRELLAEKKAMLAVVEDAVGDDVDEDVGVNGNTRAKANNDSGDNNIASSTLSIPKDPESHAVNTTAKHTALSDSTSVSNDEHASLSQRPTTPPNIQLIKTDSSDPNKQASNLTQPTSLSSQGVSTPTPTPKDHPPPLSSPSPSPSLLTSTQPPIEASTSPSTQAPIKASTPSPSKPFKTNYLTLPLATLQKLTKARDATIAWILKELDDIDSAS